MEDEDYMTDTAAAPAVEKSTEETADRKTALLPIAFFQGKELEPGATCSIRVESVQDDQAEVSYVQHSEEGGEEIVEEESVEMPMGEDMMG